MFRKISLALAVGLALSPGAGFSLSVGDIRTHSYLNQPFQADIALGQVAPEDLQDVRVQLASAAAFARAGLERPTILQQLAFNPELGSAGSPQIQVSSRDPINEPFLNFLVQVEWPAGQLQRQYTVLLDPPDYQPPQPPQVEPRRPAKAEPRTEVSRQEAPPLPKPQAVASGSAPDSPDSYGPTQPNDTLWRVASALKRPGLTTQQVAMALFEQNPHAFIDNNINKLKKGVVLRLAADTSSQTEPSPEQAQTAFRKQLRAGQMPTAPAPTTPAQSDSPPLTQAAVEPEAHLELAAPRTPTRGQETQTSEVDLEQLNDELLLLRESNVSVRQENSELKNQVQSLEGQLREIRRLLKVTSEQLAQFQQSVREHQSKPQADVVEKTSSTVASPIATDAAPETESPSLSQAAVPSPGEALPSLAGRADDLTPIRLQPIEQPTTPVAESAPEIPGDSLADLKPEPEPEPEPEPAPQETPPPAAEVPATSQEPPTAENSVSVPLATADDPAPPPAVDSPPKIQAVDAAPPATQPAVEPAAETEDSGFASVLAEIQKLYRENTIFVLAGGGVLLLFLLLGLLQARRRKARLAAENLEREDSENPYSSLFDSNTNTFAGDADNNSEAFLSDFTSSELSALQGENEEVDALAEVDVYIAYGRYRQAEDLVNEALLKHPERLDLQLKLLDIHFHSENTEAFLAAFQRLQADPQATQDAQLWDHVLQLGRQLLPDHPAFQDADRASAPPHRQDADATLQGTGVAPQDPLDEVADLTARGDHQAAVRLLKQAIDQKPTRFDLKQKLLEQYFYTGQAAAFMTGLKELQIQGFDHFDPDAWAALQALAEQLPVEQPSHESEAASEPDNFSALDDLRLDLPDLALDTSEQLDFTERHIDTADQAKIPEQLPDLTELEASLNFESASSEPLTHEHETDVPGRGMAASQSAAEPDLDLDLDLNLELDLPELDEPTSAQSDTENLAADLELDSASLARELEELSQFGTQQTPAPTVGDDESLELDSDALARELDELSQNPINTDVSTGVVDEADAATGDVDLDALEGLQLEELNLENLDDLADLDPLALSELGSDLEKELQDLELQAVESPSQAPTTESAPTETSTTTLDDNLAELDDLDNLDLGDLDALAQQADTDLAMDDRHNDWTTKLDLAQAYMDIGEMDEAQTLLQEVQTQGDAASQAQATQLLQQFG